MILGLTVRTWKTILRNLVILIGCLLVLMVIAPTYHERTPPFAEDGSFQISSQELIKHMKSSKWSVPTHELTSVKSFYDYVEAPPATCESVVVVGGRSCQNVDDHVVCLEEDLNLDHENCLVYSFGEGSRSFESAMVKLGCNVYTFDPAVRERSDHRRGERSWFYRLRLAGNQSAPLPGDKVLTLEEVSRMLGHRSRRIDYLKLDIDGEEWDVLRKMMSTRVLDRVQQLGIQAIMDVDHLAPRQRLETLKRIYQVFVGLEHSGLRLVSSRRDDEEHTCTTLPELDDQREVCMFYDMLFVRKPTFI